LDLAVIAQGRVVDLVFFVSDQTPPPGDLEQSVIQIAADRLPAPTT
jgi:hypothetical protein